MRVAIFRGESRPSDSDPIPIFSFGPIDPDHSRGIVGSGPDPWKVVVVPYGSRVATDRRTGETYLYLPGAPKPLTAAAVGDRFGV